VVLDQLKDQGRESSSNYYPDWGSAAFMDIRNVGDLYLSNVGLTALAEDERIPYIIEKKKILKEEIYLL